MDPDTVGRIEDWETEPVSAGHGGLRDLASDEFTGAITNGSGWLFMLNGRIVGVFNGTLAAFDGVDLRAYVAPHPSLPLLFAMQETGGETEAKYYTDDTPLTEVDQTLTEGGFTGFIELSENVLSGDYYVVYYGGRSLSAAFIGNAEQLLTGNEAFERANDEVGIYEVRTVDLEVHELPEPGDETAAAAGAGDPDTEGADEPTNEAAEAGTEPAAADVDAAEPEEAEEIEPATATAEDTPTEPTGSDHAPSEGSAEATDAPPRQLDEPDEPVPSDATAGTDEEASARPAEQPATGSAEDPFTEEEAWRETRTIPALDPERSDAGAESDADGQDTGGPPDAGRSRQQTTASSRSQPGARSRQQAPSQQQSRQAQDLRAALESREARIEELGAELQEVSAERDDLRAERDRLVEERDELEERVERLESQLDSMTAESSDASGAVTTKLDAEEAITQTDVFIRYGSKGEATLESAHGGRVDREEVLSNLRLEEHTRFDADSTTVNGQPYLDFLKGTLQYRFVKWLVEDLIFEIQETNSQKRLRALYNVLPRFDRAEFDGSVTSRSDEGEERVETFDVVIRDRMGQPLIVADFNDARDPATGDMMSDLVTRATAAAEGHDTIGSAFMVTASFFEPTALETADEATGGGLLDRDSKESFVKLGRKRGFHLCLAEARGEAFHVAVPEL